jgi:hypothetical protein
LQLERIATAAHAHMTEERLEALVMVYAHRELTPPIEDIITQFGNASA